jgi:hypothetical protein
MGDIAGIATISRAEHRARQGLAADGPPYVIDAEVVDSPSRRGPETAAPSVVYGLEAPEPVDEPADESAGATGTFAAASGTLTYEEAADVMRQSPAPTSPVGRNGRVRRVR